MSQAPRGIFVAAAIALTLGAVPLAAGRDFSGRALTRLQSYYGAPVSAINRAAKSDRLADIVRSRSPTQTISFRVNGLADSSVLVRMPLAQTSSNRSSAPLLMKSGAGKLAVACEPVVSALTEVAKLLQPGRCLT